MPLAERPPAPPGWAGWELALEDDLMAERYGWTLAEIDAVDRGRVRFMWAVRSIHTKAEKYLREWRKAVAQTQSTLNLLEAHRSMQDGDAVEGDGEG